jgi:hypothetical protein
VSCKSEGYSHSMVMLALQMDAPQILEIISRWYLRLVYLASTTFGFHAMAPS